MPSPTITEMDFTTALLEVMAGKRVTKREWNDPNTYLLLWGGFLCIKKDSGYHRLMISEADLFGKDWVAVQEKVPMVN